MSVSDLLVDNNYNVKCPSLTTGGVQLGGAGVVGTAVLTLGNLPEPAVSAATASTHEIPVTINGVVYKLLASNI